MTLLIWISFDRGMRCDESYISIHIDVGSWFLRFMSRYMQMAKNVLPYLGYCILIPTFSSYSTCGGASPLPSFFKTFPMQCNTEKSNSRIATTASIILQHIYDSCLQIWGSEEQQGYVLLKHGQLMLLIVAVHQLHHACRVEACCYKVLREGAR